MPPGERAAVLAALVDDAGAVVPAASAHPAIEASSGPIVAARDAVPQLRLL
jgi:hypothetical protein